MTAADDRAEQIRSRLAAATSGPWCVVDDRDWEEVRVIRGAGDRSSMPNVCTPICTVTQDDDMNDAQFLANAPADLAFLLAERAELLRRVEQAERAGAVKALEDLAETNFYDGDSDRPCDGYYDLIDRAIAFKNGADL